MRIQEFFKNNDTFTHDDHLYDLSKLMHVIKDREYDVHEVPVDTIKWILKYDTPDPERIKTADINEPIIVTWWFDEDKNQYRLVAVDGLHRIAKALLKNIQTLPAYYIDSHDLEQVKID